MAATVNVIVCFAILCKELPTGQEMVPARNAIATHAPNFVGNDELLLPTHRAFAQCTGSLHASRNAGCFQSVCSRVQLKCDGTR